MLPLTDLTKIQHRVRVDCRDILFCCNVYLSVNDICIHPNQGEVISCDQAGSIKQWDLSDNVCSHELVRFISWMFCRRRLRY